MLSRHIVIAALLLLPATSLGQTEEPLTEDEEALAQALADLHVAWADAQAEITGQDPIFRQDALSAPQVGEPLVIQPEIELWSGQQGQNVGDIALDAYRSFIRRANTIVEQLNEVEGLNITGFSLSIAGLSISFSVDDP